MENFTGKSLPIPLIYGNPQGRSRTFSQAQARSLLTNSLLKDFNLTRVKDYSLATIDNETMKASEGSKGAFMQAATTEIDGAIQAATTSLAVSLYRGADGSRGRVLAEPSVAGTTVLTLTNIEEITSFEVGQDLTLFAALSGGSAKSVDGSVTSMIISAIDRNLGTITINDAYDSSGTIAANDFIFVQGDRGLSISGLESWIPTDAPGATSFFGVDRTADVTRLGGQRYDASAQPIEEGLLDAAARVGREQGKPDHCFLNFEKWSELEKSLGSKVQYIDLTLNPSVGFRGIVIQGPRGPIKVVPDQNCPAGTAFMLQMNSWKLYSLGKAVQVLDTDGLKMLRQSSADGVEVRYGQYANLGCSAPGWNSNIQLD